MISTPNQWAGSALTTERPPSLAVTRDDARIKFGGQEEILSPRKGSMLGLCLNKRLDGPQLQPTSSQFESAEATIAPCSLSPSIPMSVSSRGGRRATLLHG